MDSDSEIREQAAHVAHEQWRRWMGYLFSKGVRNPDGTWTMPGWAVDRWTRQANMAYVDLPEDEKDTDRREGEALLQALALARPARANVLGIGYDIEYVDRPSDVDIYRRDSLWGQIDFWTRSIRIYDNGRSAEDLWHTLFHEVLHGIVAGLKIDRLKEDGADDDIDLLALGLVDVLIRNGWIRVR